MSFTGPTVAVDSSTTPARSGGRPVRLKYARHVCGGFREIALIVQRRPEVQQCLGLIAAVPNRGRVRRVALQIVQRDVGGEPKFQRNDPPQREALLIELRGLVR